MIRTVSNLAKCFEMHKLPSESALRLAVKGSTAVLVVAGLTGLAGLFAAALLVRVLTGAFLEVHEARAIKVEPVRCAVCGREGGALETLALARGYVRLRCHRECVRVEGGAS